jgi:hypothetical protein
MLRPHAGKFHFIIWIHTPPAATPGRRDQRRHNRIQLLVACESLPRHQHRLLIITRRIQNIGLDRFSCFHREGMPALYSFYCTSFHALMHQ